MNRDVILAVLRHILTFGGGAVAGSGLATDGEIQELAGALCTIVGVVWSILDKRARRKDAAQAAPQSPPALRILSVLSVLSIALLTFGMGATCKSSRLEPGGAYAPAGQEPDMAFYAIDAAYDLAYFTIDAAFKFERDNRLALWRISPQIKRALDQVRPQAVEANIKYHRARDAYKANPVPANLTTLQSVLAHMQQLAITASAVLPSSQPAPH